VLSQPHTGLGVRDYEPGVSEQGRSVTQAWQGLPEAVLGVSCMGLSKTDDDPGMSGQGLGVTCAGLGDLHSADSRLASTKKIIVMPDCSPMLKLTMRNWLGVDQGNRRVIDKIEDREASPLGKRKGVRMSTPKPALRTIRKIDNTSGKKKKILSRNMVKEMIMEYERKRKEEKDEIGLTSETLNDGENVPAMIRSVGQVVVKTTDNLGRDSGEGTKWQSENACRQQEYSTNSRVGHQRADECSPKLTSTELTGFLQGVGK
jgi:hypothetical protein